MRQERITKFLREEAMRKLDKNKSTIAELRLEAEAKEHRKKTEALRKDAAFQERMKLDAERKLVEQQKHMEELRQWTADHARELDLQAQAQMAEKERIAR